jgi:thiol:disulfide interchange protein DsbD
MFTVLAFSGLSRAHQGDQLVQVKMLADTSEVVPGKPFDVAMHYKISPGWHIYWINPGESGAATKVKVDLPPGFSVSELKFPVPESIVAPGRPRQRRRR